MNIEFYLSQKLLKILLIHQLFSKRQKLFYLKKDLKQITKSILKENVDNNSLKKLSRLFIQLNTKNLLQLNKIADELFEPFFLELSKTVNTLTFEETLSNILKIVSNPKWEKGIKLRSAPVYGERDHFDSGGYLFRKTILGWSLDFIVEELSEAVNMKPLDITYSDYRQYYANFKPLILEEARAVLASGLEQVETKKLKPISFKLQEIKKARTRLEYGGYVNSINPSSYAFSGKLPKDFDQGYGSLGVLLESPDKKQRLLGIGEYDPEKNKGYYGSLTVKLIVDESNQNQSDIFIKKFWKIYFLGSVLSSLRMYDVCTSAPNFLALETNILNPNPKEINVNRYERKRFSPVSLFYGNKTPLELNKVESDDWFHTALNKSQQDSINNFLIDSSSLQILQGPPGTGKTTTIVELLMQLSRQKKLVLVCAPSNKAVHVLVKRFKEKMPESPITFVGVEKKLPESLRPVFIHTWGNDRSKELETALKELDILIETNMLDKEEINNPKNLDLLFETHLKITQKIFESMYPTYLEFLKFGLIEDHTDFLKNLMDNIELKIFSRFSSTSSYSLKDHLILLDQLKTFLEKMKKTLDSLKNIENKRGQINPLEMHLLQHAQIIFSTLNVAGRRMMDVLKKSVDVLIVDEASQAVEAETLIPMRFAPKKILLVGDTKQLPATVISTLATEKNFDWSMMWRLLEKCDYPYSMLDTQYRMDPEIRAFPSQQYYENNLLDGDNIKTRQPLNIKGIEPCMFIDVPGKESKNGHSFLNWKEIDKILELIKYLYDLGFDIQKRLGIISFYAAQTEQLNKKLKKYKIKAKTVDSYQGDERDIMIISFVRSNTGGNIGFLRDFRRLNVAITRAKYALVCFGNAISLTKKESEVKNLIINLEKRGLLFPAKKVEFKTIPIKPKEKTSVIIKKTINSKTKLCSDFKKKGKCPRGKKCPFAHGEKELRKRKLQEIRITPVEFLKTLLPDTIKISNAVLKHLLDKDEHYAFYQSIGKKIFKIMLVKKSYSNKLNQEYSKSQLQKTITPKIMEKIINRMQLHQIISKEDRLDFVFAFIGAAYESGNNLLKIKDLLDTYWKNKKSKSKQPSKKTISKNSNTFFKKPKKPSNRKPSNKKNNKKKPPRKNP